MAQPRQHNFFDRLTLAAKFATALGIVLGIFFLLAALAVNLQTARIEQRLAADVHDAVTLHAPADHQAALSESIDGLIGTTLDSVALQVTAIMLLTTIGVVVVVYLLFIRLIRRKIQRLERRFIDVCEGDGDLRKRIEVHGNDGIDRLGRHFNRFLEKVHGIMLSVAENSRAVSTHANHVKTLNGTMTETVLRQQQDTDHVALAMQQMTASVEDETRTVEAASSAARNTETEALSGRAIVNDTVRNIRELSDELMRANEVIQRLKSDSEQIGGVLDVIRDIADQTNLLALNAAIEAARAGEQGRGFAVVADEVRSLAGRTRQSTTEIQEMIEQLQAAAIETVQVMNAGSERAISSVEQAGEAGQALERITAMVSDINGLNAEISAATVEQNNMAGDVSAGLVTINELSDASAEQARLATADIEELARLAEQLDAAVNQFRV